MDQAEQSEAKQETRLTRWLYRHGHGFLIGILYANAFDLLYEIVKGLFS